MGHDSIILSIDAEIARLNQVRALLSQGASGAPVKAGKPGRKPGRKAGKKRVLSPEARARIAEAQRKRWAKTKKKAA
jgi:hypothetical protein